MMCEGTFLKALFKSGEFECSDIFAHSENVTLIKIRLHFTLIAKGPRFGLLLIYESKGISKSK